VLTATWLLPVALIPGTWEVYEVGAAGADRDRLAADNRNAAGGAATDAGPSSAHID